MAHDFSQDALNLHRRLQGKLEIHNKYKIKDQEDLSLVYTPGVAAVSKAIAENPAQAYDYTMKGNTVAIVSDGSAVLGLGNLGAEAALPVMEGKAMLFKAYADVDAFPLCVRTQNTFEIVNLVKNLAPNFGGVNLEDIAAPRCFEIEKALQDTGIPVFHDDQHGTAIVTMAALINAARLAGKPLTSLKVVISGAGAAGVAIAELLLCVGHDFSVCEPVQELLVCDSRGILGRHRSDIADNPQKLKLANITNHQGREGGLAEAIAEADVFVGVSKPDLVSQAMVRSMAEKPVLFAMANPDPEIAPEVAYEAGAFIMATGRSDYPNQVNNVLAFPGIFRGALDSRATRISNHMKISAAHALADSVPEPRPERIIPSALDRTVAYNVAAAVQRAWQEEQAQGTAVSSDAAD
jgi:malate dehydrogenase (oxaloacetate-decarboxylating)